MLRRLTPRAPATEPDLRPGLLSVACLLFMLLPCLMLTTSLYRLTSLPFLLPARGEGGAPPPSAVLDALEVQVRAEALLVRAALRTTDVTAMAGDAVWQEVSLPAISGQPDLGGLRRELDRLHALDPMAKRVTLLPAEDTATERLVVVMDVLRGTATEPRFTEISLGSAPAGNAP